MRSNRFVALLAFLWVVWVACAYLAFVHSVPATRLAVAEIHPACATAAPLTRARPRHNYDYRPGVRHGSIA